MFETNVATKWGQEFEVLQPSSVFILMIKTKISKIFLLFNSENSELYCKVCNLTMNSKSQLSQHNNSTRHQMVQLGLSAKTDAPKVVN